MILCAYQVNACLPTTVNVNFIRYISFSDQTAESLMGEIKDMLVSRGVLCDTIPTTYSRVRSYKDMRVHSHQIFFRNNQRTSETDIRLLTPLPEDVPFIENNIEGDI